MTIVNHRALRLLGGALLSCGLLSCGDVAGIPGSGVIMLRANLNELTSAIDRAVMAADSATANKLEAAGNEARRILKDTENLEQRSYSDAQKILNSAIRDTHIISRDLRRTVTSSEQQAFQELDASLAVLSQAMDSLPILHIDPYVAAIRPGRLIVGSPMESLTIFGYLPGEPQKTVTAKIDGRDAPLVRTRKSAIRVSWPKDVQLVEESYIPVAITVKKTGWFFGLFGKKYDIVDRVRVAKSSPFSCSIKYFETNQEYFKQVKGDKPFSDEATTQSGIGKPSVVRTVSARDLFTTVVNDFGRYDLSTLTIKDPGARFEYHGACGHADPRGAVTSSGPDHVSFELQAPKIGPHLHSGWEMQDIKVFGKKIGRTKVPYSYLSGGGGSKAIIILSPTFLVAFKGASPLKEIKAESVPLGTKTYDSEVQFGSGNPWSIHVSCAFADGDERWDSGPVVVSNEDAENYGKGIGVRVADGHLYVFATDLVEGAGEDQT